MSVDELDLPCVHTGAGTDAGRCDRRRAADGAGRPVEAREQPAAPALDLAAAMAVELGAHDLRGRVRDVGVEERHEHAIVGRSRRGGAALREERLDDVEDLIRVDSDEVVGAGKLDEAGAADPLRDIRGLPRP